MMFSLVEEYPEKKERREVQLTVVISQQLNAVQRDFFLDVIDVTQEGDTLRAWNGDLFGRSHTG